jgi:AbrB family looped-hinge helix DNA binding protein
METVTLSPKYQVVIPQSIRERMGLEPGEKMQVLEYQDRIEFIPRRRLKDMRGFLKGLDTTVPREGDRS